MFSEFLTVTFFELGRTKRIFLNQIFFFPFIKLKHIYYLKQDQNSGKRVHFEGERCYLFLGSATNLCCNNTVSTEGKYP